MESVGWEKEVGVDIKIRYNKKAEVDRARRSESNSSVYPVISE